MSRVREAHALYNVHAAKTQLSRLLERVEAGEEIVIARAGRPIARLVPWVEHPEPRPLGAYRGEIEVADDFDDLPEDLLRGFEGRDET